MLQGAGAPRYNGWFTQEPQHKDLNLTYSLKSYSSTHTNKVSAKRKDLINFLLDGLEVFLDVYEASRNTSKLQMAGVRHIYSPLTQASHL